MDLSTQGGMGGGKRRVQEAKEKATRRSGNCSQEGLETERKRRGRAGDEGLSLRATLMDRTNTESFRGTEDQTV